MRLLALVLAIVVAVQTNGFALPASDAHTTQDSAQVKKVRTEIQNYENAKKKVRVTLRIGNELKGYVSQSGDVSFDLTERSGYKSTLSYEDVEKVQGAGLGRGAKIAIVVGIAMAVTAVVFVIGFKRAGY